MRELHPIAGHERALLHQPLPRVDDDLARAEQLAGDVRRARRGAAAALGARVAVEQILPRQLLDVRRAELLDLGLEIHRPHRALRARAARVRQVDVDQRRHDVQVLRVRQVVQEGRGSAARASTRNAVARLGRMRVERRDRRRRRRATRPSRARPTPDRPRYCAGVGEQQRHHQPADHAEDDQRVGVLELVALEARAGAARAAGRARTPTAPMTSTANASCDRRVELVERLAAGTARMRSLRNTPWIRISTVPAVSTMKPQKIVACIAPGDADRGRSSSARCRSSDRFLSRANG